MNAFTTVKTAISQYSIINPNTKELTTEILDVKLSEYSLFLLELKTVNNYLTVCIIPSNSDKCIYKSFENINSDKFLYSNNNDKTSFIFKTENEITKYYREHILRIHLCVDTPIKLEPSYSSRNNYNYVAETKNIIIKLIER